MPSDETLQYEKEVWGWVTGPKEGSFYLEPQDYPHKDYIAVNAPVYSIVGHTQVATYQAPDYSQALQAINESLRALGCDVSALAEVVQSLAGLHDQPATKTLAVHGVRSKRYRLKKPLYAALEDYGDEVVARLPEFDLYASGENEAEALALLQQEIVGLYEDLRESEGDLGGLPSSWLHDLSDYIEQREQSNG
jgi:hypothetical protein